MFINLINMKKLKAFIEFLRETDNLQNVRDNIAHVSIYNGYLHITY